jgi:hypothetical protein
MEITHVYVGSKNLAGQHFSAQSTDADYTGSGIEPALKMGEVGIWALRPSKGGGLEPSPDRKTFGPGWPARKGVEEAGERFAQYEALAKTIEEVNSKPVDEQPKAWQKYALSQIPEIASFAVRKSGEIPGKEYEAFLKGLFTNPQSSLFAQIAADEVLAEGEKRDWVDSPERNAMLETWVGLHLGELETDAILGRLDISWQKGETKGSRLFELLQKMAANVNYPVSTRRQVCWTLGRLGKEEPGQADGVLNELIRIIRESPEPGIRQGGALCIKHFIPLGTDRLAVVRKLMDEVKDPGVINALKEAIAKNVGKDGKD